MTSLRELVSDLRAMYGELFPHRNPENMRIADDVLAEGMLMRRELALLRKEVAELRKVVEGIKPPPNTVYVRKKMTFPFYRFQTADPE